mgnify:CR=1 FL=1
MNLYEDLKWRGLIKDVAGEDLDKLLNGKPITFYWGTDPTADSLHIGHYSSLITAKRLAKAGHHPILLVGGATGLIGDPRPSSEREIISKEVIDRNFIGIKSQVTKILDGKAEVVNNYDWLKDYSYLEFLRDIGKYINVNYMLAKDIISRRLETGITYAEFSYTLLQGYDYLHLFRDKGCVLQAAGSDQWGNITTGIELIKKIDGKEAYGFTMPLILDANGNKFGKSEGNALWLDINKTSSYSLFQYLINSDDSKVMEYLKVFTFLSREEIESTMDRHNKEPHLRIAQEVLAREFITDLHGKDEYDKAYKISKCLFNNKIDELEEDELNDAFKGVPSFKVKLGISLLDVLVGNNIASSKREAREFLASKSILVNGHVVVDADMVIDENSLLYSKYLVIRRGKKKYFIGVI